MNKFWLGVMATVLLSVGTMGFNPVEAGAETPTDVKLTEEQQEEMSNLQKDALEKKKEIINKYVEYGVFTEEKGQKIISHIEERYSKLEQNGFVPKWEKDHKKHHNND